MNLIRSLINDMGTFLDGIKAEITSIHSTANVEATVTKSVHDALDTSLAPVEAAQAASDARIADLEASVKLMADQLTSGDTTAALATAEAAVPAAPTPAPAPTADPAA
jgi:hypothetical protein